MKTFVEEVGRNLVAIVLVGCAVALAWKDRDSWGWFLALAVWFVKM